MAGAPPPAFEWVPSPLAALQAIQAARSRYPAIEPRRLGSCRVDTGQVPSGSAVRDPGPAGTGGMIPPPGARAAMLAASTRSRCPSSPQCGQAKVRPAGIRPRWGPGHGPFRIAYCPER
jgi:hypothetical protein